MISLNIWCIWMSHIIMIHNSLFLWTNLPGITPSFFLINNLYFSFTKFNVVFVSCMVTSNITNITSHPLSHHVYATLSPLNMPLQFVEWIILLANNTNPFGCSIVTQLKYFYFEQIDQFIDNNKSLRKICFISGSI